MSKNYRNILNLLIGGLILFSGIQGLMGIGSEGFIPDEIRVAFGLFLIGYGIWGFIRRNSESEKDKKEN
jgi:hypothetical protein